MDLQHRKLISDSMSQICDPYCDPSNDSGDCISSCLSYCPDICHYPFFPILPPPSLPSPPTSLIIGLVFLAITFLCICCYAIYSKFYLSSRRRSQPQPQTNEFLYEDQDPDVDHHIPNINTTGLQPTIINAISVCKYKRCDDRVEGTDCSVCLNEFQEDETLKLLPKCSHAFHIPCIDTWLRSHNNCPLCRAPIVKHTARASSSEANVDNSGVGEENRLNISEDNEEAEREMDSGIHELRIEAQEECELAVENERKRGEDSNEQGGFNTAN